MTETFLWIIAANCLGVLCFVIGYLARGLFRRK